MLNGKVSIGKGLCFNSLRCIHDQDRSLTCRKRTGHLIIEVHMSGCVDEVEDIGLAVICLIIQTDSSCLDGDAPFPFEFHIIQDLLLHITLCDRFCLFEDTVSKGGFSVVDMGDDTEIPDVVQKNIPPFLFRYHYYTTFFPGCKVFHEKKENTEHNRPVFPVNKS